MEEWYSLDAFKLFLEIHPNTKLTFLHYAIEFKRFDVLQYLIENNVVSDNDLNTPYHLENDPQNPILPIFRAGRDFDMVRYLIKNTMIDVNASSSGRTILHSACESGNLEFVKCLVKAKANPNIQLFPRFETPIWDAIRNGKFAVIRYLVENCDANLKIRNGIGETAIFECVRETSNLDIFKYLLEKEGEFDITKLKSNSDETLLFVICEHGRLEMLKHLLEQSGVDKFLIELKKENSNGLTPRDIAVVAGHLDIFHFLLDISQNNKKK